MFTHRYRNGYIHGYCYTDGCWAQLPDYSRVYCRTYAAAQAAIRNWKE